MFDAHRVLVVHGSDGLDEVTLAGATHVYEAAGGALRQFDWAPSDFDLEPAGREMMLVSGPAESAEIIRGIFQGRRRSAAQYRRGQCGSGTMDGRTIGLLAQMRSPCGRGDRQRRSARPAGQAGRAD